MSELFIFLLSIAIAYLCGSISSAILVSRVFSLPDPRVEGSKNPGATNVLRLAGKQYAGIVLLFDMLKGAFPILLAQHLFHAGPFTLGFACLAAVCGHVWPVFFGFKGGKGVATALGALLGLEVVIGVLVLLIWILVAYLSRHSSVASMASLSIAPFIAIVGMRSVDIFIPLIVITFIILYQHRNNINRLIDGEEPKLFSQDTNSEVVVEEETVVKKHAPKKKTTKKVVKKKVD